MEEPTELEKELEELQKIDDVRPSSYTLGKINKRKAIESAKKEDVKLIILISVAYYRQKYPKSTRKVIWNNPKNNFNVGEIDDVDEFLANCTEKELFELREMITYTRKEIVKKKISDRDRFDLAIVRVKKRIPGIKYIERLEAVKEKENKIVEERKEYERLIQEEREEFERNRAEASKPVEPVEPVEIIEPIEPETDEVSEGLEPYRCSMCFPTVHSKGKVYYDHLQYKVD